jgi:hypothetical protein
MADLVFALYLVIVVWLAVHMDDGDGGGRRARIPAAA